jgi:stage III sporulation protein SpoIIIAA
MQVADAAAQHAVMIEAVRLCGAEGHSRAGRVLHQLACIRGTCAWQQSQFVANEDLLCHSLPVHQVENHMPQVVVVDEIGTEAEALACRTIAERGVQLIGTAHG